jgi:hypothetical protein
MPNEPQPRTEAESVATGVTSGSPGFAPAAEADSNNYKKPRKLREAVGACSGAPDRPLSPLTSRRISALGSPRCLPARTDAAAAVSAKADCVPL